VLLAELEQVLRVRRARGEIVALIIDEAQSLSVELLEEIRLLANIETPTEKLLPLVLAGQPELRDRLNDPSLRQLKQRVTLRCEIGPLTLEETAAYIATRLARAGGDSHRIFSREAIMAIHAGARGIPRLINVICDNAMLTGFGLGRRVVDRAIVREVTRDFDIASNEEPVDSDAQAPSPASGAERLPDLPSSDRTTLDEAAPRRRLSIFGLR